MGPIRYDYSGFKKYVGKTHYRAVVEYKEKEAPQVPKTASNPSLSKSSDGLSMSMRSLFQSFPISFLLLASPSPSLSLSRV